jgi:hypothetical protein
MLMTGDGPGRTMCSRLGWLSIAPRRAFLKNPIEFSAVFTIAPEAESRV